MFHHAWKRHGEGQRPDLDAQQPRTFGVFRCGTFSRMNAEAAAPFAEGVYSPTPGITSNQSLHYGYKKAQQHIMLKH